MLWAHGARRGTFEFAHPRIRDAVYRDLNPLRRQHLHRHVGVALAARAPESGTGFQEAVGYHFAQAGDWRRALPHLRRAAEAAARLADPETTAFYLDLALRAVRALEAGAGSDGERAEWARERAALAALKGGGAKRK